MKRFRIGSERIYRIAKRGATRGLPFLTDEGSVYLEASKDRDTGYTIELVKDFDVAEPLPSADAVVLARKVWDAHAGWHGQSCDALHCQAARAILDAEAAFTDVVVPPPPDYNPNDVAFNRTPAPSDDAVTVAKGTADHHLLRGHFGGLADCAIPACQAAARILTEKEKSNA